VRGLQAKVSCILLLKDFTFTAPAQRKTYTVWDLWKTRTVSTVSTNSAIDMDVRVYSFFYVSRNSFG
jgi:hypothetical protein